MSWLSKAARLKGQALHVGMALWFLAGIKRNGTVALASSVVEDLGVSRYSEYRALRELEDAGLITVDRHTGRNPVVTILDAQEGNAAGGDVSGPEIVIEGLEGQRVGGRPATSSCGI